MLSRRRTRREAVSSTIAGMGVLIIILAAALGYVVVNPPTSSTTVTGAGSTTTTTQTGPTVTSTVVSTSTQVQTSTVQQDLVAAAKAEGGTLTDYSIVDPTSYSKFILPNFTKVYPWAKVNFVSLDPAGTITRPTSEFQAGKVVADVVEAGSFARLFTDVRNGVCAAVNLTTWLQLNGHNPGSWDSTGHWYGWSVTPYVLFYNTNLLSPSQAPKAYADLANPVYKGKIALDRPSVLGASGIAFAGLYSQLGNASWTALMKNVAANNIAFQNSGGTVQSLVSQGQYAIGMDSINGVLNSLASNLPVKIIWTSPVFAGQAGLCIAQNAPHPNMAKLYTEWFLSYAGMFAFNKGLGFPVPVPAIAAYASTAIPSNVTVSTPAIEADVYGRPSFWQNVYVSLFGS